MITLVTRPLLSNRARASMVMVKRPTSWSRQSFTSPRSSKNSWRLTGWVVSPRPHPQRPPPTTPLLQRGTLHPGRQSLQGLGPQGWCHQEIKEVLQTTTTTWLHWKRCTRWRMGMARTTSTSGTWPLLDPAPPGPATNSIFLWFLFVKNH